MASPSLKKRDYQEELYEELGSDLFVDQFDMQHYFQGLRKHKWSIAIFTALITAIAAIYVFTISPEYRSTSTLLVELQNTNVPNIEEGIIGDTESQDYYETQYEILRSRSLAHRVLNELELWNHPELLSRKLLTASDSNSTSVDPADQLDLSGSLSTKQKQVMRSFMNRLSIEPVRKTKLVKISYLSTDPELAAIVANTVGYEFINRYTEARINRSSSVSASLTQRLSELKNILDDSKNRLLDYKKANGLVTVDGSVGRLNEQELTLAIEELSDARSNLERQRNRFNEVRSLQGQTQLLESIPAIQADSLVQRLKIDQSQLQRDLDELLNRYGPRHPRVIDVRSQIDALGVSLGGQINRVVNTIVSEFRLAQSRVNDIEAQLSARKQEFQDIGSKQVELDQLESEVKTNQTIYDAFYSQINRVKSADGLESTNAELLDLAIASLSPVKPNKLLIIAVAALASLLLSLIAVLFYETLKDTIKSSRDVEKKLSQRFLGIIPQVKGGILKHSSAPVNPGLLAKYAPDLKGKKKESVEKYFESVESVRTAIHVSNNRQSHNVIVVTSSMSGEGKSSAALAVAHSLSKMERVLLIDCDLRQPTVALAVITKAEERAEHVGLTELITGTATARDCIVRGAFGQHLDVLPSGQLPEHPLEFISSLRFKKILESVSSHYDTVILDCAPIQYVSDAIILSRVSDSVIYCVQAERTSIAVIKDGLQRLQEADAYIEGVLVTKADVSKFAHYGSQHYYSELYTDSDDASVNGKKYRRFGRGKLKLTPSMLQNIQNDDSNVDLDLDTDFRKSA